MTVNGTLFNSATTTSSYSLASGTYTAGPVSGSVVLTTTGEGLTGESPINVTVALLGQRPAGPRGHGHARHAGPGRFMASQSVGGASTLSTSGGDDTHTPA